MNFVSQIGDLQHATHTTLSHNPSVTVAKNQQPNPLSGMHVGVVNPIVATPATGAKGAKPKGPRAPKANAGQGFYHYFLQLFVQ